MLVSTFDEFDRVYCSPLLPAWKISSLSFYLIWRTLIEGYQFNQQKSNFLFALHVLFFLLYFLAIIAWIVFGQILLWKDKRKDFQCLGFWQGRLLWVFLFVLDAVGVLVALFFFGVLVNFRAVSRPTVSSKEELSKLYSDRALLAKTDIAGFVEQHAHFINEQGIFAEEKPLLAVFCKKKEEVEGSCSICRGVAETGQEVAGIGCGHCFHPECLQRWLAIFPFCPQCQKSFRVALLEKLKGESK